MVVASAEMRSPAVSKELGPTEPAKWDNNFFENLFNYEWEQMKSPAGAVAMDVRRTRSADDKVPEAHDSSKRTPIQSC